MAPELRTMIQLLSEIETHLKEIPYPSGWLDLKGAVQYSSCSKSTIMRGIQSGKLKCTKKGGKIRIKRSWLDQWLIIGHSKRLTLIEKAEMQNA